MSARTPFERFEELKGSLASDPCPVVEASVRMRDGVELAADIYLPALEARPAPAIVLSTPYDKGNRLLHVPEGRLYQRHGYAFVIHDVRGRGKSEGSFRAL